MHVSPADLAQDGAAPLYLPLSLQLGLVRSDATLTPLGFTRGDLGWVECLAHAPGVLYAIDWQDTLQVFDLSDPARPRPGATLADLTDGGPYYAAVDGDRLYVTGWDLVVLDITDRLAPRVLGRLPGVRGDIAVTLGRAYVANERVLTVVDVADPTAPRSVGTYRPTEQWDFVNYVAVGGQHAFVAQNTGLTVVDVADPARPAAVARLPLSSGVGPVTVDGDRLFLCTGSDSYRLLSVDITVPTEPRILASAPLPREGCIRPPVKEGLLFTGFYHGEPTDAPALSGGLGVWDVTDARAPRELGRAVRLAYDAFGLPVATDGRYVYAAAPLDADDRGGIELLRLDRRR